MLRAVQVYALLQGRTYVIPDDIKKLAKPVLGHRLVLTQRIGMKQGEVNAVIDDILANVEVPTESEKELAHQ
jgi:MoxR-like ATPase